MLKRLEQFKEFDGKIKNQKAVILGKKELMDKAFAEGLHGSVAEFLENDYKKAETGLKELLLDQIRERGELETILCDAIPDDRTRSIMILHYLQGQNLKDISKQFGISYYYAKELNGNGRKILLGMMNHDQ